jgi:hypothetical protein
LKRAKVIVFTCGWAVIAVAAPRPAHSENAKDPPHPGCVAVAKQEYDAAKKQRLLNTRFNRYVRTGRIGRRYYWYCHP